MQLNPYLLFNGQCEEAFRFYEKCLGGKIEMLSTFGDSPMAKQMPPGMARQGHACCPEVRGRDDLDGF